MIERRSIGLNFITGHTANFRVWAPLAKTVKLSINNQTAHTLESVEMGFWQLHDISIFPGDKYQVLLDDKALPDPASLSQPDGVLGNSEAFNPNAFEWNDHLWTGVPADELFIYELHTGTFTDEGTFGAVASKLNYLKDLGITAIEIMPVAQFSGSRNWGYDGVYPFAVQHSYGGPAGLQHLVDSCHQKGIAVILDVVYNHLGPEGNFLPAFGPVFTDKYKTPWGQAINFDDEWCDGVRQFYIENALMWFRDFHIDGLRLDAIHAIKDFSAKHILSEIKEYVNALNENTYRNHFLICESDLNDIKVISPLENGGYGLDATWCDEFHHALHSLVTGEQKGYYSDFGGIGKLAKSFNDVFVYDGIWSEHRKRIFGNKPVGFAGHKFVVFTQNHDQIGNRMLGDRMSTLVDFELLKMVAGTIFLSPFTPLLFMGEEYAETHPFLYFTSHSDKKLIQQVREGRQNEFKAFMHAEKTPDPQALETFENSKLTWEGRSAQQEQMLAFYKELIRLRMSVPVWKSTDRNNISTSAIEGRNALVLTRKVESEIMVAVFNFETKDIQVSLGEYPKANWQLLLNSKDTDWGGPGNAVIPDKSTIVSPQKSLIVLLGS